MAVSEENYIRGCNSENNGNYWYINTANNELREVHKIMEIVKTDPETTISCVRLTEKLNRSKAEGRIEGKVEGKATHLINQVYKKMKKNKTVAEIAEELESELVFEHDNGLWGRISDQSVVIIRKDSDRIIAHQF